MSINWDALAQLQKEQFVENRPGEHAISSRRIEMNASLRRVVKHYREQPESEKPFYVIVTGHEAGLEKNILTWRDIDELPDEC